MQTSILTLYQDSDLLSKYKHTASLVRLQNLAILNINEDFFTIGLVVPSFYYRFYNTKKRSQLI